MSGIDNWPEDYEPVYAEQYYPEHYVDDEPPPDHGVHMQGELSVRAHRDLCARCGRPMWDRPVGARCKCGRVKGAEHGED